MSTAIVTSYPLGLSISIPSCICCAVLIPGNKFYTVTLGCPRQLLRATLHSSANKPFHTNSVANLVASQLNMPPKKTAEKPDPRPKVRGFTWAGDDTYKSMSPVAKGKDTKARSKALAEFYKSQDQAKQLRDIDGDCTQPKPTTAGSSGTSGKSQAAVEDESPEDELMPDANAPCGSKRKRKSSGATIEMSAKMPRHVSPSPAVSDSEDDEEQRRRILEAKKGKAPAGGSRRISEKSSENSDVQREERLTELRLSHFLKNHNYQVINAEDLEFDENAKLGRSADLKESLSFKYDMDLHFNFKNLYTFLPKEEYPGYWKECLKHDLGRPFKFKQHKIVFTDSTKKEDEAALTYRDKCHLTGLTIAYDIGKQVRNVSTAVAGFESQSAFNLYLDSQGKHISPLPYSDSPLHLLFVTIAMKGLE